MKLPISPIDSPLYVVAVISNPRRYLTRYDLYRKFAKYVEDSGAILYTVELAFGNREFEVTSSDNPRHIQVRSDAELWHKENLINIGISRLPADWKHVAWIDADVQFTRPDWVAETLHKLQHHPVVQMFSHAQDLGPNFEPFASYRSFAATYCKTGDIYVECGTEGYYGKEAHPGYAWAARRDAIDALGGLLQTAIVGAGDRHMAYALVGKSEASLQSGVSEAYCRSIEHWALRAQKLEGNVGYVEGGLIHYFHGAKKLRGYNSRWRILIDNEFDPYMDVYADAQGVLRLTGNKPKLRDDLMRYMSSRDEDSTQT